MKEPTSEQYTVKNFYNHIAADYDAMWNTSSADAENRLIFDMIGCDLWDGETILDVGSGTGLMLEYMSIEPSRYLGLDCSENMVKIARAKHPDYSFRHEDIRFADAEKLTHPEGFSQFGLAVATFGVLSYAGDLRRALGRIEYLLEDNGRLFFMVYREGYIPETHTMSGCAVVHNTYSASQVDAIMAVTWADFFVLENEDFIIGVGTERR